jgi:hypothetical protein
MRVGYLRRPGIGSTAVGGFLLMLGVMATAGVYTTASSGGTGGVLFVTWGLIAVGGLAVIRGLILFERSDRHP